MHMQKERKQKSHGESIRVIRKDFEPTQFATSPNVRPQTDLQHEKRSMINEIDANMLWNIQGYSLIQNVNVKSPNSTTKLHVSLVQTRNFYRTTLQMTQHYGLPALGEIGTWANMIVFPQWRRTKLLYNLNACLFWSLECYGLFLNRTEIWQQFNSSKSNGYVPVVVWFGNVQKKNSDTSGGHEDSTNYPQHTQRHKKAWNGVKRRKQWPCGRQ